MVPDFYPVAFHETPNEPTCPLVCQRGGSAYLEPVSESPQLSGPGDGGSGGVAAGFDVCRRC